MLATAAALGEELQYLLVVVGLFIVPRVLQRFRVPSAITCVGLGAVLGLGFGLFRGDGVVPLLSTLGIVSLFLFAGLEVDFGELRRGIAVIVRHLVLQALLLALGAWLAARLFDLGWQPALLVSLAVFTPSTGFILDSLPSFGLTEQQRWWVKSKAIASEFVALGALFFTVQSTSVPAFCFSTAALSALVLALPFLFQAFADRLLPWAPKSEFAFLMILALVCAFVTRHLGVYYLVGAFVVGLTAVRLRERLPALRSERLVVSIELFASFFVPFYFFKAGLHLDAESFGWNAILLGLGLALAVVPLRVAITAGLRRLSLDEPLPAASRVGLSLVPTLVFTLVLVDILRERYAVDPGLLGALVVFALVNTAVPGIVLRAPPPDFTEPEIPREQPPAAGGTAEAAPAPGPGSVPAVASRVP